jgi:hypothetical protein
MDAAAELEHRRLDQLQHQASALSSVCDELLNDTSQRSHDLQELSQVGVLAHERQTPCARCCKALFLLCPHLMKPCCWHDYTPTGA